MNSAYRSQSHVIARQNLRSVFVRGKAVDEWQDFVGWLAREICARWRRSVDVGCVTAANRLKSAAIMIFKSSA